MKRIAMISAILEEPESCQNEFNTIISSYQHIVRGRMGIPVQSDFATVSIMVIGGLDEINALTGKLGKVKNVTIKTAISKKELDNN